MRGRHRPDVRFTTGSAPGSINIDARPLMFRDFIITNRTSWLDSRTVQSLQLGPGSYPFQVAAPIAFYFTITPAGTVDYPAELEEFLSGKGTRTLRVEGVIITIDARALNTGAGVLMAYATNHNDWIVCRRVRILPARSYAVQQGGGHVVSFQFEVTRDGRVLFDPGLGFVRGNGTSTVEFLGYLLHVDARAANGTGLQVLHVWGLPFSFTKQQTVRLLPTSSHYLQVVGGKVSDAKFTLQNNGSITLNHDALALDSEGGVRVVTVTRPLQ
ncbi:hypothetical protein FXN61_07635 [Lentzea sp. PSKA42]|uniref:Uncharacterized protein n=1 Tax=Lentzea indica TaxID=2604800 RepID=A0ABX1FDB9_9PSEU|nr:hypothetical protein [Lentzea indica]NKE56711.1 hypothetical protein [Lentzea indica]